MNPARIFAGGVLGAALIAGCSAAESGSRDLESRIGKLAASFPGQIGVAVRDLSTGREFGVHADERFPTASLIKLAVMVETYHQVAEGKLSRDKVIEVKESDRAGDESVPLNMLHSGIRVTVADLLNL